MSLIAHFKLNGDTVDAIGTYSSNTPTAITYTSNGKLDGAAVFNGTSSAILLGSTINLAGNANWTVSVWVKTTSTAKMSILSNSSGGPAINDICIEGGKIAYYHYNAAWLFKQGTISINDGNWHHLAWVNFVGNKMNMYVDGVLDQSLVDSTQSTGPVNQIGKNWGSAYFNGTMDDLRIYTGTPITENEILELSFNKKMMFHYPLNGNTNDYTSNYKQTTSAISYTDYGKIGKALDMGGTSWIQPTGFNGTSVSSFTLSFWLYNVNTGSAGLFGTISGTRSINIFRYPNLDDLHWSFGVGSGVDSDVLPFDTWTHVTITYDGITHELRRYYNGSFYATTISQRARSIGEFYIGKNDSGYSSGRLNDVMMYNYILSDYEIKELAKAKILHYTFDDPYEEPTTNLHNDPVLKVAFTADQAVPKMNWGVDGTIFARTSTCPIKQPGDLMLEINITSGSGGGLYADLSRGAPSTTYTLVEGKTYTRSWWAKCSDTRSVSGHICSSNRGSDNLYLVGGDISVSPIWTRYSHTFTVAAGQGGAYHTRHIIYNYLFSVWVTNIQIEEKTTASAFTIGTRNIGISDISGYKNNGTTVLTTSPSYAVSRIGSGAFYFNGSNYISYTNTLPSGLTQEWTACAWVNLDDINTNMWLNNFNVGNYIRVSGTSNFPLLYLNSGTADYYTYGSTISSSVWHHIAFVFRNSDGLRRIYLDGVNISTYGPNNTSTPAGLPAAVKVGQAVQGYMDDYRVYATALSDADILAIYNKRANLDNLGNVQVNEIQEDKNLTPNPSFDIDSPGTLTPTGWTLEVGGAPQVVDIDGRRAVLFLGDGAYRRLRSTKYFSVTPGQTIYGSLWAKRMSGCRFYFGLYWGSGYNYFTSGGEDGMWANVGGSLVIPAGVTEVAVWIFNYSGNTGALYIDDIFVSYDPIEINFADNMSKRYTDKYKLYPTGINMALEYDEVTGTANPSAQQEISKNGSLIINGEFSEVDL